MYGSEATFWVIALIVFDVATSFPCRDLPAAGDSAVPEQGARESQQGSVSSTVVQATVIGDSLLQGVDATSAL